jgi:hypothetical protein
LFFDKTSFNMIFMVEFNNETYIYFNIKFSLLLNKKIRHLNKK